MKYSDIFTIPGSKINWYFTLWMMHILITLVPGTVLWLITLGGFRYYHLTNKLYLYLVGKSIAKHGYE